jgi:hypothetical protein
LSAIGTDPVVVEFPVDDPDGDPGPEAAIRIPGEPGGLEVTEVGPPALAAGAASAVASSRKKSSVYRPGVITIRRRPLNWSWQVTQAR